MHEEAQQLFEGVMNAEIARSREQPLQFGRYIPPDLFFKRFYYSREPVEMALRMHLNDPSVLTSFEGVEGAGKTTTLIKVLADMSPDEYPVLFIDFNEMYDDGVFRQVHDRMTWEAVVDRRIRNRITNTYFGQGSADRMSDLYCSALFGMADSTVARYANYTTQVKQLHYPLRKTQPDIERWFLDNVYESGDLGRELAAITKELLIEATASDFIRALVYRNRLPQLRHFIVVFDNADAIPKRYQPHCWAFALAASMSLGGLAKCVVCVRPENAHLPPDEPACNRRVVCRLSLGTYHKEANESRLTAADLNQIISKRQEFFAEETSDQEYMRAIQWLTELLKDQYTETMLVDLANQSLRAALNSHCSFIQYLMSYYPVDRLGVIFGLTLWGKHVQLPPPVPQWIEHTSPEVRGGLRQMLNSCFLGWVADSSKVLDAQCLDIVELVLRCEKADYCAPGCDLSFLVLARLFNNHGPMTVAELERDLAILQFPPEDVRKVIAALYGLRTEDFGYVIQITNDERVREVGDLRSDTEVEVNLRGRMLLRYITPTFTFVNRSLIKHGEYRYSGSECYYAIVNVVKHSLANLQLFARVAFVHMIELTRIAGTMNSPDWYGRYSRLYCIDGELQLTRMLGSSTGFLGSVASMIDSKEEKKALEQHIACLRTLKAIYTLDVQSIAQRKGTCEDYAKVVEQMLRYGPRATREYFTQPEYFLDIKRYIDHK